MSVSAQPNTFKYIIQSSDVRDVRERLLNAVDNAGFEEAEDLDRSSFAYLISDILRSRVYRRLDDLGFSSGLDLADCDYDEHGNFSSYFWFLNAMGRGSAKSPTPILKQCEAQVERPLSHTHIRTRSPTTTRMKCSNERLGSK